MKILIGIAGRKEVGKDTAAMRIASTFRLSCYSFATPITRACAVALDVTHNNFLELDKSAIVPDIGKTKRQFMCDMGDLLLAENPHFLINSMDARIQKNRDTLWSNNGECITDVRTENEADWVRKNNGFIIHIRNPNAKQDTHHRTETDLKCIVGDNQIYNDGTMRDFYRKVDEVITIIDAALARKSRHLK